MDFSQFLPLIAVILGFGIAIPLVSYSFKQNARNAGMLAEQILATAEKDAISIKKEKELEARDEAISIIHQAEDEAKVKLQEVRESQKIFQTVRSSWITNQNL